MEKPLWTPSPTRIAGTNLSRFMRAVQDQQGLPLDRYPRLYEWSIRHPEAFWPAVWRFCGVRASRLWDSVLEHPERMPGAQWFRGARLNFAENLLRRHDDKPALLFWGEDHHRSVMSYRELHQQTARLAAAMRGAGIRRGDRVAAFMPNLPETVAAMLAATSLGAIWSSCSPDFGVAGAVERFGQIAPKLLFTADGYFYKGRTHDSLARVAAILARLPQACRVIVVPYVAPQPDLTTLQQAVLYADFLAREQTPSLLFEQLPFDHPLYILYSSGTTGKPKCIVHGAGGTLLQHLKELVLHTDLRETDHLFYFTTCGWMMWNWLVSGLASGATLLLYDGSPFHPHPAILFDFAQQTHMSQFGTSAGYLAALEKAGIRPARTHQLTSLRTILSTGSPLAPESFDYVYRDIKADVQLASISGGTDIVSCFALGNPILPVYRGELQCCGLGMKVAVYDEAGQTVPRGTRGELVCSAPAPAMPLYFWHDADGKKYRAAYFERYPGVWAHGDYVALTRHGGMIIYGRADAVLNPGGVRIGTAEIYRQVAKLPEILESVAVAQDWHNDVRIILFVRLRPGLSLTAALITRIKTTLREQATPRHVPARIIQVSDIPRTLSGKIAELAVRDVIHHRPVVNREALANPDALKQFAHLPQLDTGA